MCRFVIVCFLTLASSGVAYGYGSPSWAGKYHYGGSRSSGKSSLASLVNGALNWFGGGIQRSYGYRNAGSYSYGYGSYGYGKSSPYSYGYGGYGKNNGYWNGGYGGGWGSGGSCGISVGSACDLLDWPQTYFENRFEKYMEDFEELSAEPGYCETQEYECLVQSFERFTGYYDYYLDVYEWSIERVGEKIEITNDKIERYQDLLDNLSEPNGKSSGCFGWIYEYLRRCAVNRLEYKVDQLTAELDDLTDCQDKLTADYDENLLFKEDLLEFLEEIKEPCDTPPVPEPSTALLAASMLVTMLTAFRRRSARR